MSALLDAKGITKRFAGITALDGVDLDVGVGEIVGLIGPKGAGKTTLFNCFLGLARPDEGSVAFEGRDLARVAPHKRARLGIARTFQRMELFAGMTVREHLLVAERSRRNDGALWKDVFIGGKPKSDEIRRADAMMEFFELTADADRQVEALSLGRGRVVELARALMLEPKLLLLDEPSSGLDVDESAVIAQKLRELNQTKGVAILLVEHDIAMVRELVSRVFVLDFGTLIASGTTVDVFNDSAVQAAYLGSSDA